jgi:putative spermidine/putrescine transport system permease protein
MRILNRTLQWSIISLGILFFTLPIYAASIFAFESKDGTFTLNPLRNASANEQIMNSLDLTMRIAFGTVAVTLLLLVPTVAYLHLATPGARAWVEFLTLTPLVIPPIVQGIGFLYSMPISLKATPYSLIFAYTILAIPFSYRAIDAAFSSIDIRTMFDAARSLGASHLAIIFRIVIPNILSGIFGAIFLIVALVLGEFAYASLLLWDTFPTVLAVAGLSDASTAVALSVLSLVGVWLILGGLSIFNRNKRELMRSGIG